MKPDPALSYADRKLGARRAPIFRDSADERKAARSWWRLYELVGRALVHDNFESWARDAVAVLDAIDTGKDL
jgi:hypothetical protein